MKGYKTKDIMTPGYELPTTREGLEAVYRTLAKTADQRLVRLEQAAARGGDSNPYANVKEWAYKRGMRDISEWSGADAMRFNVAPPTQLVDLEAKIEDIKTFLSLKTSTIAGIKETFKDRADSLNEKFPGLGFKWDDMAEYFDSDLAEEMDKNYGSQTKFLVLAELRKNKKKILRGIEKSKKINIKVPDKMVEGFVKETIADFGPQVAEYLKKVK